MKIFFKNNIDVFFFTNFSLNAEIVNELVISGNKKGKRRNYKSLWRY